MMECLEGQTLKHRIQGKPEKAQEVLEWAIKAVDVLEAVHKKGIVTSSRRVIECTKRSDVTLEREDLYVQPKGFS